MALAVFSGSNGSGGAGFLLVLTAQNRHPRVQVSPRSMIVAVAIPSPPPFQHCTNRIKHYYYKAWQSLRSLELHKMEEPPWGRNWERRQVSQIEDTFQITCDPFFFISVLSTPRLQVLLPNLNPSAIPKFMFYFQIGLLHASTNRQLQIHSHRNQTLIENN